MVFCRFFYQLILINRIFVNINLAMNYKCIHFLLVFFIFHCVFANYKFEGKINYKHHKVYLSLVEDYRKINGIYKEQIIGNVISDSLGNFSFEGNNLPNSNRIYRIHIETCEDSSKNNYIIGECPQSQYINFIANNFSEINLPISTFENQIFCEVKSNHKSAFLLQKIDSIKQNIYFSNYENQGKTSQELNIKKWYFNLLNFARSCNEPLVKLYVYDLISSKTSSSYSFYLKDVQNNAFFENLLEELKLVYPNENFTQQYENELIVDLYTNKAKTNYYLIFLIFLILIILIYLFLKFYKIKKSKNLNNNSEMILSNENLINLLSNQEKNVFDLILKEKTNKEIANELFISESTVKTHINAVFKKLKISNRKDIIGKYFQKI